MNRRRVARYVAVVLFAVCLSLASFRIGGGDGETIYQVTKSIVEGRGGAIRAPSSDAVVVDAWGETIPSDQLRGGGPYGAWSIDGRYYATKELRSVAQCLQRWGPLGTSPCRKGGRKAMGRSVWPGGVVGQSWERSDLVLPYASTGLG